MRKNPASHKKSNLRWWQMIAVSIFSFGALGLLFAFIPPSYSPTALNIGLALALLATLAAIWNWYTDSWWARLSVAFLGSFLLLAISMRAWMGAIPIVWIWLFTILGAYLLAWAIPAICPSVSSLLWREQTAPRTRLGRAFTRYIIAAAPVAGVLGASIGMFGSRLGELKVTLAAAGSLLSIASIAIAFEVAYQLWPERPWRQRTDIDKRGN